MRRALRAAAAALMILGGASAAPAQTVTGPRADGRLAPEEFAILPWGTSEGSQETFNEIRECGFNLAGFVRPENLDKVQAAGLKAFVIDSSVHVDDSWASRPAEELTSRVKALAARTASHPAVFGYYFRDEPLGHMFPALAAACAALREAAPKAVAYVNLLPNYAAIADYPGYIESFIQTVKPTVLSYDHYAMMDDGSLRAGYFQNLEAMRAASLKHNLPFWNIVLSNAHFRYAEPSPTTLNFQMWTTLAYGARGISYFTYFTPQIGNYRLGPLDQFGHRTPTWDMLRNVNLQIHALGPVYKTLQSVNVFHHPEVPEGCRGLDTSRFVESIGGGQFLVGEFEGPDKEPYVMVVNTSLKESVTFSVALKGGGAISMVNAWNGHIQPWTGENNWLAPGQGMLLKGKRK